MRVHQEWERVYVYGRLVLWFARRLREEVDAKNNESAPLFISMEHVKMRGRTESRVVWFPKSGTNEFELFAE
jgi:hypothetical protein